jgi:methylmalonyl-CoA mutase N-terminal domain/subunit
VITVVAFVALVAEVIVGVNKYRLAEEGKINVLEIDNSIVREKQARPPNSLKFLFSPFFIFFF